MFYHASAGLFGHPLSILNVLCLFSLLADELLLHITLWFTAHSMTFSCSFGFNGLMYWTHLD